jgi:hypothetical protein
MPVKTKEEYLEISEDMSPGKPEYCCAAILTQLAVDMGVDHIKYKSIKMLDNKSEVVVLKASNGIERTGSGVDRCEATSDAASKF